MSKARKARKQRLVAHLERVAREEAGLATPATVDRFAVVKSGDHETKTQRRKRLRERAEQRKAAGLPPVAVAKKSSQVSNVVRREIAEKRSQIYHRPIRANESRPIIAGALGTGRNQR